MIDTNNYLDKERPLSEAEKPVKTNISNYVFNNIYDLVKKVFRAFYEKIGNGEKLYNQLSSKLGCATIGLSGQNGGEMNNICDLNIIAPSRDTPRIQEMHIIIGHTICHLIDQEFEN